LSGFASALKLAESTRNKLLSTGSPKLDELIGGVVGGGFYLFYGEEGLLDEVFMHLLVNTLRLEEEGCVIYAICGNYRVERNVIEVESLLQLMEAAGLSTERELRKIRLLTASSADQQSQLACVLERMLEESDVRLVLVRGLYKLQLDDARKRHREKVVEEVQRSISRIRQACASQGVPLVTSAREVKAKLLPRAEAGSFLDHLANVTIYLRSNGEEGFRRAYLVKSSVRTLGSVEYCFQGVEGLNRNTPVLRDSFNETVAGLKENFRDSLLRTDRSEAFDRLVEVWSLEAGAITYPGYGSLFDLLLLTAAVDNRKVVEELSERLRCFEEKGCES
jgi:hypothetical protein